MAPAVSSGNNWNVSGEGWITIFSQSGLVARPNTWYVPLGAGGHVTVSPEPASPDIVKMINLASKRGKVAYIAVSPWTALLLALEGVITPKVLGAAVETARLITVKVKLGGREYKLVIREEKTDSAAAYDKSDKII